MAVTGSNLEPAGSGGGLCSDGIAPGGGAVSRAALCEDRVRQVAGVSA